VIRTLGRATLGTLGGAAFGGAYAATTVCTGFTCQLNRMPSVPILFCSLAGLFIALSSRYDA
jgi:hypothetical protein